jgi:3-oxoacyl-[acyl-carrier-protein] synthase-3
MEAYLGCVGDQPSRLRSIILRRNGIQQRHYALQKGGTPTHTNAEMTALAIRALFDESQTLAQIELLCCGTSTPDQFLPSHGSMVHGHLPEAGPIEVLSPAGGCCSGMHAFRYAYLSLMLGETKYAVSAGSERSAAMMTRDQFDVELAQLKAIEDNPYLAFNKDFLRWMLSDGAGAFLLGTDKNEDGPSLRVDWVDGCSYANQVETCMYSGADKSPEGTLISYKDFGASERASKSVMSMKQDVRLLRDHMVQLACHWLEQVLRKRKYSVDELTYFVPHLSSYLFAQPVTDSLEALGIAIPRDKWFTNLDTKGNVGAASIYLAVEELMQHGQLQKGDRLLLFVPESARFSYFVASLTVC